MMAARKISSHAAFAVAEVVGGSTLATDRFKSGLRVRPGVDRTGLCPQSSIGLHRVGRRAARELGIQTVIMVKLFPRPRRAQHSDKRISDCAAAQWPRG